MSNKRISKVKEEEYHSDDEPLLKLPTTRQMEKMRDHGRVSRPSHISLPSPLHIMTEQRVTGVSEAKTIQFMTRIMLTTKKLSIEERGVLYEEMIEACENNIGTSRSSIDLNEIENENDEEDYCSRIFYSDKGVLIETVQMVRKNGNGKISTMTSEEKTYSDICKTNIYGDHGRHVEGCLNIKCKETISSKNQVYTRSEKFHIGLKNEQTGHNYEINSEKKTFDPTNTVKLDERIWFDSQNIGILIDHQATADMTKYWKHEKGTFAEQLNDYHEINFSFDPSTTPSSSSNSTTPSSSQSPSRSSSGCSLRSILAKAKLTPRNVATPKKEMDSSRQMKASETLTLAELVDKMRSTPNKQNRTLDLTSPDSSKPSPSQKLDRKRKTPAKSSDTTRSTPNSTNNLKSEDSVKMTPKRKMSELAQKMRNGLKHTPDKQDATRSSVSTSASSKSGASTEKKRPKKIEKVRKETPKKLVQIDASFQPIVLNDGRPNHKKQYTEDIEIGMMINGDPYRFDLKTILVACKKPVTQLKSVKFQGKCVWEEMVQHQKMIEICIGVIMMIGMFGNANVIVAIVRKKVLRTKKGMFLLILAISHFFINVSEIIGLLMHYRFTPMSRRKCYQYNILYTFFVLLQPSLFLINALDLCFSVVIPLKHMLWKKSRYVFIMTIPAVAFSICSIILSLRNVSDEIAPHCIFMLAPDPLVYHCLTSINVFENVITLVIVLTSICIASKKSKNMSLNRHSSSASAKDGQNSLYRATFFIVITYISFWIVITITFKIVISTLGEEKAVSFLSYVVVAFMPVFCHTYFIAYYRSVKFRKAFQEHFHWMSCGLLFPMIFDKSASGSIHPPSSNQAHQLTDSK